MFGAYPNPPRRRGTAIPVRTGAGGHCNLFLRRPIKKGFPRPNGFIRAGVAILYASPRRVFVVARSVNTPYIFQTENFPGEPLRALLNCIRQHKPRGSPQIYVP